MTYLRRPTAPRAVLRALLPGLLITLLPEAAPAQAVWINELHYDNVGSDVDEFVELAGPAGTALDGWSIVLYNGSSGAGYRTTGLSGTLDEAPTFPGGGLGVLSFSVGSLQNGSPDGLALVDPSNAVVQFLSYEGAFTASDGPAAGLTSIDIGVEEDGASTPAGSSLQLTGAGTAYADFAWSGPAPASPGALNDGQTVPLPPADADADGVLDDDDLCPGTVIPEGIPALKPNRWALLDDDVVFDTEDRGNGEGSGAGYDTGDTGGCSCEQIVDALDLGLGHSRYGCSTSVMDTWTAQAAGGGSAPAAASAGSGRASFEAGAGAAPGRYAVEGSYPNPFNARTVLRFGLPEAARVKLAVYDALGRPVRVLVEGALPAGRHESVFDAAALPAGLYLAYLHTPRGAFLHKMLLSK